MYFAFFLLKHFNIFSASSNLVLAFRLPHCPADVLGLSRKSQHFPSSLRPFLLSHIPHLKATPFFFKTLPKDLLNPQSACS